SAAWDAFSFPPQAGNVAAVAARAKPLINRRRFQKIASGVTADSGNEWSKTRAIFIAKVSTFGAQCDGGLAAPTRSVVGKFARPISGHSDFDLRSVTPRCARRLNICAFVHLHSGHLHVELNFRLAHNDQASATVAQSDQ